MNFSLTKNHPIQLNQCPNLQSPKWVSYLSTIPYEAGEVPLDTVTASVQGWVNHLRYGNTVGLRKAVLSKMTLPAPRLDRKEA